MPAPEATSSTMYPRNHEKSVELHDVSMDPQEEIIETDLSAPIQRKPRQSFQKRWRRAQFALRMVVLAVTAVSALFVAVVEILMLICGGSNREPSAYLGGYPQLISHYVLSFCGLMLSTLVVLFEVDFQIFPATLVFNQLRILRFYFARGMVQIFLAAVVYSQIVRSNLRWLWIMKDLAAGLLFLVGIFHFVFGVCCLDRIVLGLRTSKHNQFKLARGSTE
mmetsp:Transcript_7198/g.26956  ORF Transcript_7198/g.26956 Transcript_7198/m.26956 type:complete len:221 (+) Transcript_7198:579-1241(+)|eukprot:CAMPEP_0117445434 /NCGR_PEP_ID=MMETSP0759-20121206/5793_1 /TAXON_ID=63605 /ORGANISM="Percolomonas cosmopolitus, Strain WS" /LENGTH=220 /DNA_ID=CAMNT_0005237609 /DNA_START=578 /DNA_END=1240 /DNA_ORIENTATION=-